MFCPIFIMPKIFAVYYISKKSQMSVSHWRNFTLDDLGNYDNIFTGDFILQRG